jgi:hypothetical protein
MGDGFAARRRAGAGAPAVLVDELDVGGSFLASLSTGLGSTSGKKRASRNALTHGLTTPMAGAAVTREIEALAQQVALTPVAGDAKEGSILEGCGAGNLSISPILLFAMTAALTGSFTGRPSTQRRHIPIYTFDVASAGAHKRFYLRPVWTHPVLCPPPPAVLSRTVLAPQESLAPGQDRFPIPK